MFRVPISELKRRRMFPIFLKLGGEEAALRILASKGKAPSGSLMSKWKSLGKIPTLRAVVLLDECASRGVQANYEQDCTTPTHAPEAQSEAAE